MEIMLDSVLKRSKHIKEVIIAKVDEQEEGLYHEWVRNGITFKKFARPVPSLWYGHGLGLNACIDRASQDYIMFCDPDVFFYMPVDEFYLDTMQKYDLNYVGVSHHNAINQAFSFFPYVINSLVKRDTLPDKDWLKGKLKLRGPMLHRTELLPDDPGEPADGQYMIPNPIPEFVERFPNKSPTSLFDVGCNLWLWNEERKGKWLSFQTTDCHTYNSIFNRGNVKAERFPKQKLVYHLGSGSRNEDVDYNLFKTEYEGSHHT